MAGKPATINGLALLRILVKKKGGRSVVKMTILFVDYVRHEICMICLEYLHDLIGVVLIVPLGHNLMCALA